MCSVAEILRRNREDGGKHISVEVLPPLKGNGLQTIFQTVDRLRGLSPSFINITTHHSECVYKELPAGTYEKLNLIRRPGTLSIAAAIQYRYGIKVIPHVICAGASADDIEYELIDLQYSGLTDILLLRGDKAHDQKRFTPVPGGWSHTTELIRQVVRYNEGYFLDGSTQKHPGDPFRFGVACYPEKHDEAPNLEMDMEYLKAKQDMGAQYAICQLFYDNSKYFSFVAKARESGITIPIIPAIKPLSKLTQYTDIPRTFHVDLPVELARDFAKCRSDEDAKRLGIEWATAQCKELYASGCGTIHFYTVSALDSMDAICRSF